MRFVAARYALPCLLVVAWLEPSRAADRCPQPPRTVRVAVYDDAGVGRSLQEVVRAVEGCSGVRYERIRAEDIREGRLTEFDVLIQPGGSGSKQGKCLGEEGRAKIRTFTENGGGFLGICAGAYLATNDYDWSLHILDAKVLDKKHWARGHGEVQVRLTDQGKKLLEIDDELIGIYYYQGPLLAPGEDPDLPDYDALATFETEIAENGAPAGVMKGTTAIAAAGFGRGRVFCFSPHPEKTEGLDGLVCSAVRWAAGGNTEDPHDEALSPGDDRR